MLISPAFAQEGIFGGGDMFTSLLPFIVIFVIFYMLLIRPQQKKAKQHKEMLAGIRRGDRVVTGGGIIGRVSRVEGDGELIVEIAPNLRVRVLRATVGDLMTRGEPAVGERPRKEKDKPAVERQSADRDYYSVLGVRQNAGGDAISKAYRKFAKAHDADAKGDDSEAKAKFAEIQEAYETLKDPRIRKVYNALGHGEYVKIQGE